MNQCLLQCNLDKYLTLTCIAIEVLVTTWFNNYISRIKDIVHLEIKGDLNGSVYLTGVKMFTIVICDHFI